ncbi:hypothetical protein AJ79_00481 [Helicocarpus griseus UAMH5409]|uniref:FAD synthase n=1 Tax=Helicocarpus griseus UAMH5409 TaxID=1447875 RepID=A0A2B7YC22_9EURO|nr:hypothetical protein AJ79_00481 [Helicocarpus griseus UAMH5409]
MANPLSTPPAEDKILSNGIDPAQENSTLQENGQPQPAQKSNTNAPTKPHPAPAQSTAQEFLIEDHTTHPPLSAVTASLHQKVTSFLSEPHDASTILYRVQNQTRISLSVIQESLRRFSLHELSLSYNGGKDCLVMLILFLASLHPLPPAGTVNAGDDKTTPTPSTIPAIYAQPPHPFRSVEEFVASSSHTYHLSLVRYTTSPPTTTLRTAFASYLSLHPQIRAIFVGTRRTDPHGEKLTHFDRTDHGWPDFVRIHPVIDWHYAEIWAFIRHLGIEYCPLYDEGYTSLGGTDDTHPNPKLKRGQQDSSSGVGDGADSTSEKKGDAAFRPAYELMDDDEERLGRD